MNTIKGTKQTINIIPISEMEPESGYQRPTNPDHVERIVKRFDEAKLGVLTVSKRDGQYHIIDGAHRAKAMRKLGYTHASCIILDGLTLIEEANLFRFQGKDRRLVTPLAFFKAGLLAGDKHCRMIENTAKANGFQIGSGANEFFKIAAVQTLFKIADEYGYDILHDTLYLLAKTWKKNPSASQAISLLGVAEFVYRYGTADFAGRMEDRFITVYSEYKDVFRFRDPSSNNLRERFCRAIVTVYNNTLPYYSRERLVWRG